MWRERPAKKMWMKEMSDYIGRKEDEDSIVKKKQRERKKGKKWGKETVVTQRWNVGGIIREKKKRKQVAKLYTKRKMVQVTRNKWEGRWWLGKKGKGDSD